MVIIQYYKYDRRKMDKLEAISATIIKEALACKEPWSLENSVSICYRTVIKTYRACRVN